MSAWSEYKKKPEYKKKLGEARPWDLLNKANYSDEDTARKRMDICNVCPQLLQATKQCKQCGCIMPLKVKLSNATCPIGKW